MSQQFEALPEASPDGLGVTDSTGSERCFFIWVGPEVMSRFPGSEGYWGILHSSGFGMADLSDGCSVCGRDPVWLLASGEALMSVASSVIWALLESNS